MSVEQIHEQKESCEVDVFLPGHEPRTTTALFARTKKLLVEREGGRCAVCGRTAEDSGHPLESHHHPIERSLANMIDWDRFRKDCEAGLWGKFAQAFDWSTFSTDDPYSFVDDQTVNGLLLCADHHRGKNEGIHWMPFPYFVAQRYGKEGYQFTPTEVIHHEHL
ncbi:hypothetical protein [Caballeronia sp. INML3B]|uniref:hypothetical protein n=1 Tax=Caballeronia sp. INML3B TaxID=2921749 RepID=UPI0020279204|nr:hypothetical protein [Caballeronia sp. INML3B]